MNIPERRAFLALCASSGLTSTLLPGVLWAQMQPGTKVVTLEMVRQAAQLAGLTWTDAECQDLVDSLSSLARGAEGIDKPSLTNASPLPLHFDPVPPGLPLPPAPPAVFRTTPAPRVTRPASLETVAFWPVTHLARLIETRQVTSLALTTMYLERLKRHNGVLNCVAALTETRALAEARSADAEIAAGTYRGVLHGIPYGVKDIVAATGAPTRWGAPPFEQQTFSVDATVVQRLSAAGAVLVAKLTTGEMAFGDQWAGGRTNSPWRPEEGSSGSSAGSGAATAAGLVAFSIGTDTGGSILSPAARCGIVGLRPTFGRVSRHGVMAAGTTLDKIGPMCRHAEDCAIVLRAIAGPDDQDLAVVRDRPVSFDVTAALPKRIGYVPAMLEAETDPEARANNTRALDLLRRLGCTTHATTFPGGDLSYYIEYTERAAAFDSFTKTGRHADLRPRTSRYLRACQLVTAVDYLQANRRRAVIMQEVARAMAEVDAVMFTALTLDSRTSLNPVMSLTGHPSIAVPNGFRANGTPTGVMFSGHLYREGDLIALARAWQGARDDAFRQPPAFAPA
jgi:Asp-tRNA(Asn)/Glu-tRNA(Gln) amidotransferase A subunit family amidase